jgi:hypothetical protein
MSVKIPVKDEALVFDSCDALRIFPNNGGSITLEQYSHTHGEEVIFTIPTCYVELVVKALRKTKRDIESVK